VADDPLRARRVLADVGDELADRLDHPPVRRVRTIDQNEDGERVVIAALVRRALDVQPAQLPRPTQLVDREVVPDAVPAVDGVVTVDRPQVGSGVPTDQRGRGVVNRDVDDVGEHARQTDNRLRRQLPRAARVDLKRHVAPFA